MKNIFFKNLYSLFSFYCIFMVISCSNDAETKYMIVQVPAEEKEKTYSVNVLNNIICKENLQGIDCLYFKEGAEDIPYVNIEELCNYYFTVEYPEKYKVLITSKNNNYTSTVLIDLTKRKIYFSNYDHYMSQFYGGSSKKTFFDLANVKENDFIKIEKSFNSWGAPIEVNFSGFEDFVLCAEIDGKLNYYVSLNTFGNLFTAFKSVVYNGKEVYSRNEIIDKIVNREEFREEFYRFDEGTGKKMRSSALTDFTYNELCINLDLNYGLKELHGNKFDCFDSYFEYVGLKSKLLDPDPEIFCKAIWELCHAYFSDYHSIFMLASYYCGYDIAKKFAERVETGDENLLTGNSLYEKMVLYKTARQNVYREKVPGLEFSDDGKTAIVRFDQYTTSGDSDLNAIINETNLELGKTTEDICNSIKENYTAIQKDIKTEYYLYCVNKMIKKNPEVENVILDMSNNGGGACRTAVATLAWMLGEVQINTTNSITGAKFSSVYVCDINADGKFDENDTIKDKKLFCLISPASFSCGNMVPAMLKSSDRVVLLGETSGGGSACVYETMAADSTIFQISSRYVMSENKNGSNYDIDKGIEPHVRLQPETLYNKEKICSIVANMN